ncbi:MAG: HD-GYP domain-containing protein [Desulfuromonadaceae bacterium]|nr:HD-GYP domain-containing protein [Desulfuromonadaceae bacterium]
MMSPSPKYSIKATIQRQLFFRLLIACVLISVCLAVTVFFIEFHKLGNQVGRRADEIVIRFNDEVRPLLDEAQLAQTSALNAKLKALSIAGKVNLGMGHLVYSAIHDLSGNTIVVEKDAQYIYAQKVEALMSSLDHQVSAQAGAYHKYRDIDNTAHIQLVYPLTNSQGERAAIVEGLYAISAHVQHQVQQQIIYSVLGTVGIVVLTTLILYPILITLMQRLSKQTENLLQANIETLRVLGNAVAKRDSNTYVHNYRVTVYSVMLAETLGLSSHSIQSLIKGAFLHDIGKIGISDEILLKKGPLTRDEQESMRHHVTHGVDIVKHSDWLKDAKDVVRYHHEQFNGNGYPCGLSGEHIPINARIFAIADVFDALTSRRSYKKPIPFDKALKILEEGRGSHFDPELLDIFKGIAPALYQQVSTLSQGALQTQLDNITRQYFTKEMYDNA